MRFLHTGDWHIGKALYGCSRLDEQQQLIEEVLDIAARERIDCLLFAGDLYDSFAPSPDAERLVYHFFGELAARRIPAVVIGGNHDHPQRLEAVRPILQRLNIAVTPQVVRPNAGGVIEIGESRIAMLPWVWAAKLTKAEEALNPQDKLTQNYQQRMDGMIQMLTELFMPDRVNILMGHVYVANAELSPGAERTLCTAQGYAVSAQSFPPTASYIALGHLHRPQELSAPSPLYYSGSPLQLDFGEQGQAKRVIVVDAKPGLKAKIESFPLSSGRRLCDAKGTLAELQARAAEYGNDFLRVTVKLPKPQLGIAEKVREILPHAVQVSTELPAPEAAPAKPAERDENATPQALFARYYKDERAGDAPAPLLEAFDELYEEALRASR